MYKIIEVKKRNDFQTGMKKSSLLFVYGAQSYICPNSSSHMLWNLDSFLLNLCTRKHYSTEDNISTKRYHQQLMHLNTQMSKFQGYRCSIWASIALELFTFAFV